jgi:uncharacterized protein (DUF736 family)
MTNTNTNGAGAKTDWKKNELGALWKRESKGSGEKYLKGVLKFQEAVVAGQEVEVIIFANKTKKAENHPDLRVYITEATNGASAPKSTTAKIATKPVAAPVEVAVDSQELL